MKLFTSPENPPIHNKAYDLLCSDASGYLDIFIPTHTHTHMHKLFQLQHRICEEQYSSMTCQTIYFLMITAKYTNRWQSTLKITKFYYEFALQKLTIIRRVLAMISTPTKAWEMILFSWLGYSWLWSVHNIFFR